MESENFLKTFDQLPPELKEHIFVKQLVDRCKQKHKQLQEIKQLKLGYTSPDHYTPSHSEIFKQAKIEISLSSDLESLELF
jgi:hypothetical protein